MIPKVPSRTPHSLVERKLHESFGNVAGTVGNVLVKSVGRLSIASKAESDIGDTEKMLTFIEYSG